MRRHFPYILFFIAASCIYFFEMFNGRLIPVHEDIIKYFYPAMAQVKESYLAGNLPLWNRLGFSGSPLLASPQAAALYPVTVLPLLVLPLSWAFNLDIIIHSALGGIFTYLYVQRVGAGRFSSLMAGVLFAFIGYRIRFLGHISVFHASTWVPLVMYCYERIRRDSTLGSMSLAAIAISLQLYSGHPQISFYTYMLVAFYMLFYVFSLDENKRSMFLATGAGALGLGMLLAAPQLYASYQLSSLSIRSSIGYPDFASYSFNPQGVAGFFFPSLHNGTLNGYVGQLPLFFILTGAIMAWRRNIHVRFWSLAALFSLLFAFGAFFPTLHKLMLHLPVYRSFRSPSRHLVELCFALSVLFGISLSVILEKGEKRGVVWIVALSGIASAVPPAVFALTGKGARPELTILAFLSFLLVLTSAVWKRSWMKYMVVLIVLLEVIAFRQVDLARTDELLAYRQDMFAYLAKHEGRTAFFTEADSDHLSRLHGVMTLEGYDSMMINDYNTLFQMGGTGHRPRAWRTVLESDCMLGMFNVRYLVLPPRMKFAFHESNAFKPLFRTGQDWLYENLSSLPLAWPVKRLVVIGPIEELRDALYRCSFDPSQEVAVSEHSLMDIGSTDFTLGEVSIIEHADGRMLLSTDFTGAGFVVIAEQYYPGWQALVDGESVPLYKANGVLRGVMVPPGRHELLLIYRPRMIYFLMGLSALVFVFAILLIYRERKGWNETHNLE